MESEPAGDIPEPSPGFKLSSILWAVVLVGVAVAVAGPVLLIMGSKANVKFDTRFGTVGASVGSTVPGGSRQP